MTRAEIPTMRRVRIRAHTVAGRWSIPASSTSCQPGSAAGARLQVLRWAHADAGAPKWRPLLRESWPHSSAKPILQSVETFRAEHPRRSPARTSSEQRHDGTRTPARGAATSHVATGAQRMSARTGCVSDADRSLS